jgi:branched-chain amino acid aminotransferase
MEGELIFAKDGFLHKKDIQNSDNHINSIYEVVRIIDGIPLFFEDHFRRLQKSCDNFDYSPHKYNELNNILKQLIQINKFSSGNYKIEYRFFPLQVELFVYQIQHFYPSKEMFNCGVKLKTFKAERPNPNVKQSIINNKIRNLTDGMINNSEIFEVVLINDNNEVTEGSRTNIFFVDNRTIYSAPRTQILEGITRAKVIEIIKDLRFQLVEKQILSTDLNFFSGCFLTGTSPKVLPVNSLDNYKYDVNLTSIQEIANHYDKAISNYCNSFTWS